jgi:hypothetical protein
MTNSIQAIIRKSFTTTLTFTDTPSQTLRKQLLADGFTFRNGQWVRNEAASQIVDEENVAAAIAA